MLEKRQKIYEKIFRWNEPFYKVYEIISGWNKSIIGVITELLKNLIKIDKLVLKWRELKNTKPLEGWLKDLNDAFLGNWFDYISTSVNFFFTCLGTIKNACEWVDINRKHDEYRAAIGKVITKLTPAPIVGIVAIQIKGYFDGKLDKLSLAIDDLQQQLKVAPTDLLRQEIEKLKNEKEVVEKILKLNGLKLQLQLKPPQTDQQKQELKKKLAELELELAKNEIYKAYKKNKKLLKYKVALARLCVQDPGFAREISKAENEEKRIILLERHLKDLGTLPPLDLLNLPPDFLKARKWGNKFIAEWNAQTSERKWKGFEILKDVLSILSNDLNPFKSLTDFLSDTCELISCYHLVDECRKEDSEYKNVLKVIKNAPNIKGFIHDLENKWRNKKQFSKEERREIKRQLVLARFYEDNGDFVTELNNPSTDPIKFLHNFFEHLKVKQPQAAAIPNQFQAAAGSIPQVKLEKWQNNLRLELENRAIKHRVKWIDAIKAFLSLFSHVMILMLWIAGFIVGAAALGTLTLVLGIAALGLTAIKFSLDCYILVKEFIDVVIFGKGDKGEKLHEKLGWSKASGYLGKAALVFKAFFTEGFHIRTAKLIKVLLISLILGALLLFNVASLPVTIILTSVVVGLILVDPITSLINKAYKKYTANKIEEQQKFGPQLEQHQVSQQQSQQQQVPQQQSQQRR